MLAVVYSFSARGAELSKKICSALSDIGCEAHGETVSKYSESSGLKAMLPDHNEACRRDFSRCSLIVFVGAVGIAVRTIAPYIKNKLVDPAVISVDERANFIIPLLAGHIGGANEFSRYLAAALGAVACVTTATDVNGLFAVDEWAARNNMIIDSLTRAKDFAAAIVGGESVGFYHDEEFKLVNSLPQGIVEDQGLAVGMAITLDRSVTPFEKTVRLLPKIVHLGIGCRRGTKMEKIESLVLRCAADLKLDLRTIVGVASVDLKKDEEGLLAFAEKYRYPVNFYTAEQLNSVSGEFTPSSFVKSITGVNNVCERSAVCDARGGKLILRKTSADGVTLAVAVENLELDLLKSGLKKD